MFTLVLILCFRLTISYIQTNIRINGSENVNGKNRYIWIPDDEAGDLHPVDVSERIIDKDDSCNEYAGETNSYWLYTRKFDDDAQLIHFGRKDSLNRSRYNSKRPLIVITHGWKSYGNTKGCARVRKAFLQNSDCNVIVMDWSFDASRRKYICVTKAITQVAKNLANFIDWLYKNRGGSSNRLHLVGFGLGAHVVGNAAFDLRTKYNRLPRRITGLDPAGKTFLYGKSLKRRDARYVEVIHTDDASTGIHKPIGHTDFYPNGGTSQPGCKYKRGCSHLRAYFLFAASLVHEHILFGRKCQDLVHAKLNQCKGKFFPMGTASLTKKGEGLYGLTTVGEWPYDISFQPQQQSISHRESDELSSTN